MNAPFAPTGKIDLRYAPDHELFFIHVPKCAGSSVLEAMQPWSRFPREELSADLGAELPQGVSRGPALYFEHPALGPVHLNHLPLFAIREHFPRTFALVEGATRFAILRDPAERFLSATSQYLREFKGVGGSHIADDQLREAAREVIAVLRDKGRFADRNSIHFAPQNWFVEDPQSGLKVEMFSIDQIDRLNAWLSARTGRDVVIPSENATVRPKGKFALLHTAMARAGRMVPFAIRNRMVPLVLKLPIYNRSWKSMQFEFDRETEQFIADYYRRDQELFDAVRAS